MERFCPKRRRLSFNLELTIAQSANENRLPDKRPGTSYWHSEIPVLRDWQRRLSGAFRAFVSPPPTSTPDRRPSP
eukprot:4044950-Pyramimonas_sp.AAC.1